MTVPPMHPTRRNDEMPPCREYFVYAVVYREPLEMHSLWATAEIAGKVAADLDGYGERPCEWQVVPMAVGTVLPASLAGDW